MLQPGRYVGRLNDCTSLYVQVCMYRSLFTHCSARTGCHQQVKTDLGLMLRLLHGVFVVRASPSVSVSVSEAALSTTHLSQISN